MASTGFNLEAPKAGIIPDSRLTRKETPNPINTLIVESTKVKSSTILEAKRVASQTNNKPNTPPINAKKHCFK